MDSDKIYAQVSAHYSAASQGRTAAYESAIAKSFGYSDGELASVPEGSNLGLSCGNPLAIASIREGETIIDLGSGAGFDAFLAANRIGPSGKVIGVDMNKDMIAKANKIKSETNKTNVEFVSAGITDMSVLESGIADCIISNCVINLVPATEKHLVFREIFRLLKPGGRVAISDILAKKQLPEKLRSDMAMYVGCISGASLVDEYDKFLKDAGFEEILITDTKSDLNVYFQIDEDGSKKPECCIPAKAEKSEEERCCNPSSELCCAPKSSSPCCTANCCMPENDYVNLAESNLNDWAGSFKIYAVKN
ncbi:S-adenosyl-L-methionine-dependent methyltransferase [Mariannaea sp. PMI_226]|nr:S-adenosyl-L-methionine-dependent methyltransferase [Mariannaea sp. PMI_226]